MAEATREIDEPRAELSSAEEMLEMIVMKEDEIRQQITRAENEAQRVVEEAKLDAAAKKRDAA
jgi:ferritin